MASLVRVFRATVERFPLREPAVLRPDPWMLVVAALTGAILGLGVALTARLSFAVPLALVFAAIFSGAELLVLRRQLRVLRARQACAPHLEVGESLTLSEGDESSVILSLERPFGATLFATPDRDRLVLALTHREGVAIVSSSAPTGLRHVDLLSRSVTISSVDLPVTPGLPTFDRGDRLLDTLAALEARSPGCTERVYLSDANRVDVVLEGTLLRAGHLDFDLRAPLCHRSFIFHEGSSKTAQAYQATAVRQGDREVVLVSLAPTGDITSPSLIDPPSEGPLASEAVRGALARDVHLSRGLVDLPPPRAQRVAIDRAFVSRLRVALHLAPVEIVPVRPSAPEILLTPAGGSRGLRHSRP